MEFRDFDPLAPLVGEARESARDKHLISNDIAVLMEDNGIDRTDLARKCHISKEELDDLLDGDIQKAKIGKLRRILDEAQNWVPTTAPARAMRF